MEAFAEKLKTPSYILYSIFILIPLALVALLPAVTVVGMKPEIADLVLLYDLVFPVLAAVYSEYILMHVITSYSIHYTKLYEAGMA